MKSTVPFITEKTSRSLQSLRDNIITNKLGDGWQMVRIIDGQINKNYPLDSGYQSLLKYTA